MDIDEIGGDGERVFHQVVGTPADTGDMNETDLGPPGRTDDRGREHGHPPRGATRSTALGGSAAVLPCPEPTLGSGVDPAVVAQQARAVAREHRLAELSGVVNATHGAIVGVVAEALETGDWKGTGLRSPAHWLAWKTGVSSATANRIVAIASRRGELPAVDDALESGLLSLDVCALIARHVPRGFDRAAVELARNATWGNLRNVIPQYDFDTDTADADSREDDRAENDGEAGVRADDDSVGPNPGAEDTGTDTAGDGHGRSEDGGSGPSDDGRSGHGARTAGPDGEGHVEDGHGDPDRHRWHPFNRSDRSGDPARITWWWDDDRRLRLSASLPTDQGLLLEAAFDAARHDAWHRRHPDGPGDGDADAPSTASNTGSCTGTGSGTDGRAADGTTTGGATASRPAPTWITPRRSRMRSPSSPAAIWTMGRANATTAIDTASTLTWSCRPMAGTNSAAISAPSYRTTSGT